MSFWIEAGTAGFDFVCRMVDRLREPALLSRPSVTLPSTPEMPSLVDVDSFSVLMVGYRKGVLAQPAEWLGELGAEVRWISPRLEVLTALADEPAPQLRPLPTHLAVDLDSISYRHRAVDDGFPPPRRQPTGRAPSHVMIDLDAFGSVMRAYDYLHDLRQRRPDLPVILVSEDFSSNDFSTERLPLCDASLRAPVVFSALEFALSEALDVNNPQWVERLKALQRSL